MRSLNDEGGSALVAALGAVVVLTTLGSAFALLATTEARIAAGYRDGVQAFYAAEAALDRAMLDVAEDWAAALALPLAADADEPGWRLVLDGWLHELLPEVPGGARIRLVVWLRDEPPEGDGIIVLRARADAAGSVRRVVEATVARNGAGVRRLWWREWR